MPVNLLLENKWRLRGTAVLQGMSPVQSTEEQLPVKFLPLSLYSKYSLVELLTNVMIYWVTSSIVPSMRYYKENLSKDPNLNAYNR